jgi:GTPase Era involved in 16S rRNA processing
MFKALSTPSIDAFRVHFIQEQLKSQSLAPGTVVRLTATGRTGSGKSTLGNRLIGLSDLLRTSGFQDCTDHVHIITFPSGFEYVDLPGIASDDRLENYNRCALGITQVADWPQIERLTIEKHDTRGNSRTDDYAVTKLPTKLHRPDIILYLVAPHQQLLRYDTTYMRDLLQCHGPDKVLFILNLFSHEPGRKNNVVTDRNIADARAKIKETFNKAGINSQGNPPQIVEVNCWTGEGLPALISHAAGMLEVQQGRLFADVIRYQQKKTTDAYLTEVKHSLLPLLAQVAFYKATEPKQGTSPLAAAGKTVQDFVSTIIGYQIDMSAHYQNEIKTLMKKITDDCMSTITEPIIETRKKDIYNQQAIYREERKPIEEIIEIPQPPRRVRHQYTILGIRTPFYEHVLVPTESRYEKRVVGYETKQIFEGYKDVYSHTESWEEDTGRRHTVGRNPQPYGAKGVAFVITYMQALLWDASRKKQDLHTFHQNVARKIEKCLDDNDWTSQSNLEYLFKHELHTIFPLEFDEVFRKKASI